MMTLTRDLGLGFRGTLTAMSRHRDELVEVFCAKPGAALDVQCEGVPS